MATVNLRVGGDSDNMQPAAFRGRPQNMSCGHLRIDTATTNRGAADVLQVFDIPALSFVRTVIHVATAEGGVATVDFGTADLATDFANDLDVNVATTNAAPATVFEGFFVADAIAQILVNNALDAAILDVYWEITKL